MLSWILYDAIKRLKIKKVAVKLLFLAEREANEPDTPTYLSSMFYFYFEVYGVRLRAHCKMTAPDFGLSVVVTINTQVQSYTFF